MSSEGTPVPCPHRRSHHKASMKRCSSSQGAMSLPGVYLCILYLLSLSSCVISVSKASGSTISALTRRRILCELQEIRTDNISLAHPFNASDKHDSGIRLAPVRGNMLEWHFSFTGTEGSAYEEGLYHGAIILDQSYPNKAPIIQMLTPSGRWEVGKPICLSGTSLSCIDTIRLLTLDAPCSFSLSSRDLGFELDTSYSSFIFEELHDDAAEGGGRNYCNIR